MAKSKPKVYVLIEPRMSSSSKLPAGALARVKKKLLQSVTKAVAKGLPAQFSTDPKDAPEKKAAKGKANALKLTATLALTIKDKNSPIMFAAVTGLFPEAINFPDMPGLMVSDRVKVTSRTTAPNTSDREIVGTVAFLLMDGVPKTTTQVLTEKKFVKKARELGIGV